MGGCRESGGRRGGIASSRAITGRWVGDVVELPGTPDALIVAISWSVSQATSTLPPSGLPISRCTERHPRGADPGDQRPGDEVGVATEGLQVAGQGGWDRVGGRDVAFRDVAPLGYERAARWGRGGRTGSWSRERPV